MNKIQCGKILKCDFYLLRGLMLPLLLMTTAGIIAAIPIFDVSIAIIAALKDDGTNMGKVYELGGPDIISMHELVTSFGSVNFKLLRFVTCESL